MRRFSLFRHPVPVTKQGIDARSRPPSTRRGAILIIIACGAALFLGFLALVTDIGWTYYHQLKLQTAINAGWKAGFDELLALRASPDEPDSQATNDRIADHIRAVVGLNYPDVPPPDVTVTFGKSSYAQPSGPLVLTVFGTRNVPLFFANIFGISFFRVQAIRSVDSDIGLEPGIIPIAIPHGEVKEPQPGMYHCILFKEHETFTPGLEYLLQPGSIFLNTASPSSQPEPELKKINNSGVIDPDNLLGTGTGDSEYSRRILTGFQSPLQINDRIILQPGISNGTTISRIAARIASGAANAILPITDIPPEVVSSSANRGAQTIYDLKGMDFPEGKYSPAEYSFTAAVRIIGFAEFELTKPGDSEQGQIRGRFLRYIIKPGFSENEASGKMGGSE